MVGFQIIFVIVMLWLNLHLQIDEVEEKLNMETNKIQLDDDQILADANVTTCGITQNFSYYSYTGNVSRKTMTLASLNDCLKECLLQVFVNCAFEKRLDCDLFIVYQHDDSSFVKNLFHNLHYAVRLQITIPYFGNYKMELSNYDRYTIYGGCSERIWSENKQISETTRDSICKTWDKVIKFGLFLQAHRILKKQTRKQSEVPLQLFA